MRLFRKNGRRLGALLCAGALLGGLILWAGAAGPETVNAALRTDITINIDGKARNFYNAAAQEVHPILYSGTTYLPVRAIGELMGKNVDWNQATLTVSLTGTRSAPAVTGQPDTSAKNSQILAELHPDFTISVDGAVRTFYDAKGNRVYPLLYNGSVYLPVRAVGELMGKTVDWNQAALTITLGGGSQVTDADTFSGTGTGTSSNTQTSANGGTITLDAAKLLVLSDAGLAAGQVTWTKHKLDWDDGRQIYELEFYTETGAEYEYEVDAAAGVILDRDYEAGRGPVQTGAYIGMDRAREIALGRVPGAASNSVTELKLDADHDRAKYEVELVYNGTEYEIEIDAVTGDVLKLSSNHRVIERQAS